MNVLSVKKDDLINPCEKPFHWFFYTGEIRNNKKIAQCFECLKLIKSKKNVYSINK